jgi:hypothetical protein
MNNVKLIAAFLFVMLHLFSKGQTQIPSTNIYTNGEKTGINNKYPNANLDVKGKAKFRGLNGGKVNIDESLAAIIVGTGASRIGNIGTYFPGIGFNHLLTYSNSTVSSWDNQLHAWIGTRLIATPTSELSALIFATTTKTGEKATQFPTEKMVILPTGEVGIGIKKPLEKLHVDGAIRATEIKVIAQTADFVFEEDYQLKPLSEVEQFVKENKHLPEIPSAKKMEKDGVNLAEMNKLLLQKVEELTLYLIEKDKELKEIKREITKLKENQK